MLQNVELPWFAFWVAENESKIVQLCLDRVILTGHQMMNSVSNFENLLLLYFLTAVEYYKGALR